MSNIVDIEDMLTEDIVAQYKIKPNFYFSD